MVAKSSSSPEKLVARLIALMAAVGLLLQLGVVLTHTHDAPEAARATLRFFSYFTILSNLLVVLACGLAHPFFTSPRVRGAVALYIAVTAAVYITILAGTWQPTGVLWISNGLLHYWVPAGYLGFWLVQAYRPRQRPRLRFGDALRWLSFPAAYLAWTLVRGAWVHEYPYPFMDVTAIGMLAVVRNAAVLLVLFVLLGLVLVGLDKLAGRRVLASTSPPPC
jgi:hypothetical protein